jgi:hypothetical protein
VERMRLRCLSQLAINFPRYGWSARVPQGSSNSAPLAISRQCSTPRLRKVVGRIPVDELRYGERRQLPAMGASNITMR